MKQKDMDVHLTSMASIANKTCDRNTNCFVLRYATILVLLTVASTGDLVSKAIATPFTFGFNGVIENDHLDDLFPGKSFGDTYSGTFTVDNSAAAINVTPDVATYDGSLFNVTIQGISHNVHSFRVWKTSPPGGGVEFLFDVGNGDTAFLSLRSTSGLYNSTDVPTSFSVANFDSLSRFIQHSSSFGDDFSDKGSVDTITPNTADPLTFNFSGIVAENQLDTLFPNKSIGDPYSGSFTVDPTATTTHTAPDATFYNGNSFDLTIEGISHSVREFRVWNSSPPGGGIEFVFNAGGDTAFFSLRSTSDLYDNTDVPTSYNVADFDNLSRISQRIDSFSLTGEGSITEIAPIPEPSSIVLFTLSLMGMTCCRRFRG